MGISEKTIIPANEIVNYIPQRNPIVMVDEFFGVEQELSVSGLTVLEDNIFCENGQLSDCGIIEHIAQSAALRVGYVCKSEEKDVSIGFIGAVNKLQFFNLPNVGDKIRSEIRIEQEVMNITLISAISYVDEKKVAECKMKIYLQE